MIRRHHISLIGLLIGLLFTSPAQAELSKNALDAYHDVLRSYVRRGKVDYDGIQRRGLKKLDKFLEEVASAVPPVKREERITFYIDAYNAIVLRSVIKHGMPRSVLDVEGFFNKDKHEIAGNQWTLDHLEKEVLLPYAKDPRLHFVVVCAAYGCPVLESRPFTGSNLEKRLERATKRYLRTPAGAQFQDNKLYLSKIFDWYKADFGDREALIKFLRGYLPQEIRTKIGPDPHIGYLDYNWTLNRQ